MMRTPNDEFDVREFERRWDGMVYAMDGGLWLHRHVWQGRPMAHLISTDRAKLVRYGKRVGLDEARLQFHPLKDPRTSVRRDAWHWDIGGPLLRRVVATSVRTTQLVD